LEETVVERVAPPAVATSAARLGITRRAALSLPGLALLPGSATAADYPSRGISIVVPFAPGGGTDVLARIIAKYMGDTWRHPVVVDNRPGASGKLGTELLLRATPDGYMLLMASTGALMTVAGKDKPFSVRQELAPITLAAAPAYLLVAHPSVGVANVKELLDAARHKPREIAFGSSGPGSASHLAAELFSAMGAVELLHVPYRGTGAALNDLLSGRISLMFAPPQTVAGAVKDGALRVLALTAEQRSPLIPEVPTVAESGIPGYSAVGWFGLLAPRGTPDNVISEIHAVTVRALELPETKERLASLGAVPEPMRPDAYASYIDADIAKWQRLIRERNIPME
jgi:tripartite-type tricarboxylate transporter receptor subunit TctC